jgi:hypothetical protein
MPLFAVTDPTYSLGSTQRECEEAVEAHGGNSPNVQWLACFAGRSHNRRSDQGDSRMGMFPRDVLTHCMKALAHVTKSPLDPVTTCGMDVTSKA